MQIMKVGTRVYIEDEKKVGVISEMGNEAKVETMDGTLTKSVTLLEVVTVVYESFKMLENIIGVKMPLIITKGQDNYTLHIWYDAYDRVVYACYKDRSTNKMLTGTSVKYGKNIRSAKKKLKDKIKKEGYI